MAFVELPSRLPTVVLVALFSLTGLICYFIGWCVYTLYLHPLAKFPGPKVAAITQLWHAWSWLNGHHPRILQKAHKKYGNVVRVAPNELSFNTVQAHNDIYSAPTRNRKPFIKDATFYKNGDSVRVLIFEIDATEHAWQRKLIAPSFSGTTLRKQEYIIQHYVDLLVEKMGSLSAASRGAGVDAVEAMLWLGFDIMGEMTFSESFGAVEASKTHFWVSVIRDSAHAAMLPALIERMPLLRFVLPYMVSKSAIQNRKKHYVYTQETIRKRVRLQEEHPETATTDICGPVIANGKMDETSLVSFAQAMVIAGADTVAHALTGATYFLCANPACLKELQDEIRGLGSYEELTGTRLASLRYLNAVIEETLRAFPPAAFGLPRVSPGEYVDGHFVPAGAVVSAPHWVITHNESEWQDPYTFRPERWLEGGVSQPRNLAFSTGPRACLGLGQAWLEIRVTLAKLVYSYDMAFAREHGDWLGDAKMFTMWREVPLMVNYRPRKTH
ncbi:cytochrome P450 [Xylaria bambusicola]|uniref:cytochrome P450 n=1 Tax=Xylaria bambusicola TaxID=326684 RepID=UPI002008C4E2|nr:cytochrome P450 [Xylaria bambusicola]KAI0525423.1 cytochrome P450 [Xylaria bambusicola]